jgi:hypothetical protein
LVVDKYAAAWNAGSVPKLVHGAFCSAGRFCPIRSPIPYASLAESDELRTVTVQLQQCTGVVQT